MYIRVCLQIKYLNELDNSIPNLFFILFLNKYAFLTSFLKTHFICSVIKKINIFILQSFKYLDENVI